jgi:hypothetical protein
MAKKYTQEELAEKRIITYMNLYNVDRGMAERLDNMQLQFERGCVLVEEYKSKMNRANRLLKASGNRHLAEENIRLENEVARLKSEIIDLERADIWVAERLKKLDKLEAILSPYDDD